MTPYTPYSTPFRLEVGGTYRTRAGQVVSITAVECENLYSYVGSNGNCYLDDGRYSLRGLTDFDIVARVHSLTPARTENMTTPAAPVIPEIPRPRGPSRHAEMIKKWADGIIIEYKGPHCDEWRELLPPGESNVTWKDNVEYREKVFPIERFIGVTRTANSFAMSMPYLSELAMRASSIRFVSIVKLSIDPATGKIVNMEDVET